MNTTHHHFRTNLSAIGAGILGWAFFSLVDTTAKWLSQDYAAAQIVFVSSAIGAVICGLWIVAKQGWRGFAPTEWKLYTARGVLMAINAYCIILALQHIALADFYGVVFLSPLIVTLLAMLILKERVGIHRIAAIIAGFIGVIVLAGPQFADNNIGLIMAFIATCLTSMGAIIVRKIGPGARAIHHAFFPFIAGTIIYAPMVIWGEPMRMPATALDITLFLALAPLSFLGFLFYASAFSRVSETAIVAPFHYTQMIWGVLLGYILFDQLPTTPTIAGSVIIACAGLYVIWREHIHYKQQLT